MKTVLALGAAVLLVLAAPLAVAGPDLEGPPDPGSGCRPTCFDVHAPDLLGPPESGCRPQC